MRLNPTAFCDDGGGGGEFAMNVMELSIAPTTPNPSSEGLDILFSAPSHGAAQIEVLDIAGRQVKAVHANGGG